MRPTTIVMALLLLTSMFSMVGSAAIDDEQGLVVFLTTTEDVEHFIGSTVKLDVRTMLHGEYYPAVVDVYAGSRENPVILSEVGTGHHRVSSTSRTI